MRTVLALITGLCLLAPVTADSTTSKTQRRNQKQADKQYLEALDAIRDGSVEKGRTLLEKALQLDPENSGALTARELLRQHDIQQKVSAANEALAANQREVAIQGFRNALALDAGNAAAQDGLRSALAQREVAVGTEPRIRFRDAD